LRIRRGFITNTLFSDLEETVKLIRNMLIKVKVFPEAKKDEVLKKTKDAYMINVKAKAERGKANWKVREILASYFGLPLNKIRLVKGGKKANKIFEVNKLGSNYMPAFKSGGIS